MLWRMCHSLIAHTLGATRRLSQKEREAGSSGGEECTAYILGLGWESDPLFTYILL